MKRRHEMSTPSITIFRVPSLLLLGLFLLVPASYEGSVPEIPSPKNIIRNNDSSTSGITIVPRTLVRTQTVPSFSTVPSVAVSSPVNLNRDQNEALSTTKKPSSSSTTPSGTSAESSIPASTAYETLEMSSSTTVNPEVNPINTKISLYTRMNPVLGFLLVPGEETTNVERASSFDPDDKLRVIIHGSFDGLDYGHWMRDMKQKLLDVEKTNILVVDWSESAGTGSTAHRLNNVRVIGHQVARVLEDFISVKGAKPEKIHIIAHGDGTFAADVIGRRIKRIGRITGLNPTGPNFDNLPIDERLDRTDALFVDVIHTDQQNGTLSLYKRGTTKPIGHVDFYPNGGLTQPGCSVEEIDNLIKKAMSEGLRSFLSCSHYRAIDYFLESMTTDTRCLHMAYECANYQDFLRGICGHCHDASHLCSEMGFRADLYYNQLVRKERKDPIKLYYSTSRRKPYCLYHYNVQVNLAPEPNQVRGGLLKLRVDGEKEAIEIRLYGGTNSFKAGYTTGLIATHNSDIGKIKGVSVNWMPNSIMTLLYGENLYIEDVRISQIGWQENKLKTDDVHTYCPDSRTGLVTPFYGETYFTNTSSCNYQYLR